MDKYKIESHKLIYHVQRVSDWLGGKVIYPIYVEIAPAGGCNHRCTYCALDYVGYKPRFLDEVMLKTRLSQMSKAGIKSVMYAGEGEPLLNKGIADIINHTKRCGIDVALTTNAVLYSKKLAQNTLADITWIKVSINGATKRTYSMIHRSPRQDFDKVIKNMSYSAKLKRKKHYKCALGMQLLLLPENSHEVLALAKIARDIGMNYFVVKPYSHHPRSKTTRYKNIKYSKYMHLEGKLRGLNSADFNTIFRIGTMKKWDSKQRNYKRCLALPFWAYIDAAGNIWGCSAYLEDKRFLYGNIYKNNFKDIWEGIKRKKLLKFAQERLDITECRVNCRMDEINRYLWELKNPPEHVNFI
ncbi:MAG: radical SAM protein [Candidatus Omnitrophota bacterium]|nr:MAG: radical SAM protein [Candidatus Omnitrophota bacterium]